MSYLVWRDRNQPSIYIAIDGYQSTWSRNCQELIEQLSADLIKRTLEPCRQAMKDAGYSKSDIDEVILVGGSTRILRSRDSRRIFWQKPSKGVNPDEVVALGASIQGGILSGDVDEDMSLQTLRRFP